ncbi:toxin, partial [Pseudomonas sp. Pseusp122]
MSLHTQTPLLAANDPRGLTVRAVAYSRSNEHQPAEHRSTRSVYDAAGRLTAQQDPRLPAPNLTTIYSLSGQPLLTDSVDAGWRLMLPGEAGQLVDNWDGRGSRRQIDYDEMMRPMTMVEQDQAVERFSYGGPQAAEHNQCNQVTRHDDPAGTLRWPDYNLLGSPVSEV